MKRIRIVKLGPKSVTKHLKLVGKSVMERTKWSLEKVRWSMFSQEEGLANILRKLRKMAKKILRKFKKRSKTRVASYKKIGLAHVWETDFLEFSCYWFYLLIIDLCVISVGFTIGAGKDSKTVPAVRIASIPRIVL